MGPDEQAHTLSHNYGHLLTETLEWQLETF